MTKIMTVEELKVGDVFQLATVYSEVLVVDEIREDRAYPNTMLITYHYLGNDQRNTHGLIKTTLIELITRMEEVFS